MKEEIVKFLNDIAPNQWSKKIMGAPEYVTYLNQQYPNVLLKDQIKSLVHGYNPYCLVCNKPLSYGGNKITYTCSLECKNIHNETNESFCKRRQKTHEEKENLRKKAKDRYLNITNHPRYGAILSDESKRKISDALIGHVPSDIAIENQRKAFALRKERGYISPLKNRKATSAQIEGARRGLETVNLNKITQKICNINDLCKTNGYIILTHDDKFYNFRLECQRCKHIFNYTCQGFRESTKHGQKLCPNCYPRQQIVSNIEIELREYIVSIYSGTIVYNDREKLSGKELDIYFPDLNLAIELDGIYWHSEQVHQNKLNIKHKNGFAYARGIRLIQIFEDEWVYNKNIVKSRLSHILKLHNDKKIYARKCVIKHIDNATKTIFLKENHIQGNDVSKIRYGAFYQNELVAVMTFKPTNMVKGGNGSVMELSRFCVKLNHSITGIASKLMKNYKQEYSKDWKTLISYADARWSVGNLYKTLGFSYVTHTSPSYFYIIDGRRWHRSNFMKHKIVTVETSHLSEYEIMLNRGYDRIWDAGALKFEMVMVD